MTSLCMRCALRALRNSSSPSLSRTLTTTASRSKVLPTFQSTSSEELDGLLSTLRSKHLIPRILRANERKLIFADKHRQYLAENPQTVTLGDEEIELEWIDQKTEIPNRVKLLKRIMKLMRDGEKGDWNNLPAILIGLQQVKKTPTPRQMAKMVRLAANAGRFGVILQCLHRAPVTGMTMKHEEVLEAVMWAVRELGRGAEGGWERDGLEKAIRDANEIASLLEDEDHGTGRFIHNNDPRKRPEVIAVFLELAAVWAVKFEGGQDGSGRVKAFVERLMANIDGVETPHDTEPGSEGPQKEILNGVPILHGLKLSQKVLGDQMPSAQAAQQVIKNWEQGLALIVSKLQEKGVSEGTYADQALQVWRDRIQD